MGWALQCVRDGPVAGGRRREPVAAAVQAIAPVVAPAPVAPVSRAFSVVTAPRSTRSRQRATVGAHEATASSKQRRVTSSESISSSEESSAFTEADASAIVESTRVVFVHSQTDLASSLSPKLHSVLQGEYRVINSLALLALPLHHYILSYKLQFMGISVYIIVIM